MKPIFLLLAFAPLLSWSQAGDVPIGEWKSHQSFTQAFKAVETRDFIYCATRYGLFNLHKEDMGITTISTIDGLSAVELNAIGYDSKHDYVFVAYTNGQIDVIGDGFIRGVPYIANTTTILGSKNINAFYFNANKAYIATNFGIVVYDIEGDEIIESYVNIDPTGNKLEVLDVAVYKNRVYAATPMGLRSGSLNDNLLDFNFWETTFKEPISIIEPFANELMVYSDSNTLYNYNGNTFNIQEENIVIKHLDVSNGNLVVTKDNDIEYYNEDWDKTIIKTNAPGHGLLTEDGTIWVSVSPYGLVQFADEGPRYIRPNGPATHNCWTIDYFDGEIWVASGGLDLAYNPVGTNNGVYSYIDGSWSNYNDLTTPAISQLRDMHLVRIDETTGKKYFASYNYGLAELENETFTVWDKSNTNGALLSPGDDPSPDGLIRLAGMDVDSQGNVWLTQQFASKQLVLKTSNDEWHNFNIGNNKRVNDVLVDASNNKWVVKHLEGLYIYNHGQNITDPSDDLIISLDASQGNGNLPASDVYALCLDKEQDVWVGTSDGVVVFYNTDAFFSGDNFDGTRPIVEENGESAFLLEGQKINAITTDGANQKWFATQNGVFVTSANGQEIRYTFNESNSPLLSNNVRDIKINGETGEVFIATDKGIISYRAEATEGKPEHTGVTVYPNPVRPGYSGPIAVNGLVENANVKITDISGNIVYETTAQGGQAVWNGKNFGGKEVASGVYLVFSSNLSGRETFISKIMIIR